MSTWELESMADIFAGTIEFSWFRAKSPNVVGLKIEDLGKKFEDTLFPLVASRQVLIDDINDRFDREVDLDEVPWVILSEKYRGWKEKNYPGQKKLRLEDHLIDALNEESAYPIRGNNIFIDTSAFPPYWRIHDRGGWTSGGFKGQAHKKKIPKRSYLGISYRASLEIVGVFDEWMGGLLDIVIGPATGVAMERGAGGRIKARIGLGRPARILPVGFKTSL